MNYVPYRLLITRGSLLAMVCAVVVLIWLTGAQLLERYYLWRLVNGDYETRCAAAEGLGKVGSVRAISVLVEHLRNAPVELSGPHDFEAVELHYSAKALAEIGAPAVPDLLRIVNDPVYTERRSIKRVQAAKAIVHIGEPAVSALVAALQDADIRESLAILQILGEIGGPQGVEVLVNGLRDRDWAIRLSAISALRSAGRQDRQAAVSALRDLLHAEQDPEVRRAVQMALDEIGS